MKLTTYKIKHTDAQGNVTHWCHDAVNGVWDLMDASERIQGPTLFAGKVQAALNLENAIDLYGIEGFTIETIKD